MAVLAGSTRMPFSVITKPRNVVLVTSNSHLRISTYRPASRSFRRTSRTCCRCSFLVLEKIKTSSTYAEQMSSKQSIRTVLMYRWKVAGPLQSPKGKTTGSKEPYLVRKAAHAVDSGSMRIRLKAWRTSSLVNNDELANRSSVSVINGRGYRSFLVKTFNC